MGSEELKRIYKSTRDKKWLGVLGGLAEYLKVDASLMRILFVILTIFSFGIPAVIIYIILGMVLPRDIDVE